jgi:DNA-binding NtrC family response regulator
MSKRHRILIAERNPHIRGYLTRELSAAGYDALPVKTLSELHHWVVSNQPMDLLVLDPNLPEDGLTQSLETLLVQLQTIPVIFHCLPGDCPLYLRKRDRSIFIEKTGTSLTALKACIQDFLPQGLELLI